jgi:hypothetical protein
MDRSKHLGGLVGPTIVALVTSEFPLVQPHLYDAQIPPVVYLSGALLFVGGLAVVRAHNVWSRSWTLLITLSGWTALALGLVRMFAASAYSHASAGASSTFFLVVEGVLLLQGVIITVMSYRRTNG